MSSAVLRDCYVRGKYRDVEVIEHDKALQRVMTAIIKNGAGLFEQFADSEGFKQWLGDSVFELVWEGVA